MTPETLIAKRKKKREYNTCAVITSFKKYSSLLVVCILFLNLLDNPLDFLSLAVVDAQVILIVLNGTTHAIKRLSHLALLVGDKGLCEQAFCASIVIPSQFLPEPIQNDC